MTESHIEELREEEEVFVFPLSFAQQRLWFLHQLDPLDVSYNMPAAPRLRGRLDLHALEETLSEIVRRHEVLRTTFDIIDGEPVQVIAPPAPLTLPVTDLSAWPATQRENEAQRLATEEAQKPFNLSTGPLLRASLLRLDDEDHVLLVTMHHIISDGWSLSVLINEIAALYTAFAAGRPSPLPELPIQYADFAQWQRDWLQGQRLDEQLDYWKRQLAGAAPVLELPADRPRPQVQNFQGPYVHFKLSERLSEELKALCQQEGVTLFMLLLAAFQILLYRYTSQTDIVVGTPIAGRNRSEIEGLIGFFVNTLVLRTDLSGNPRFRELLKRVQEVALGAYAHQEVPFEQLVEELQPERDLTHMPLVQVLFVWQNTPEATLDLPGLTLSSIESDNGTSRFDLALNAWETERGVAGFLRYRSELFDAASIERCLRHYQNLLAAIVLNPNRRIDELKLLTPAEEKQLQDWNPTPLNDAPERLLHNLFEEHARRTPERVAVVFEDEQISYGELNARANRLAHYLLKHGVGPEVIVGICVERSVEMLTGLLGILKAGGAYLPLDPDYPQERLAFMLQDSGATLLLTQNELLKNLPALDAHAICLDADRQQIAQESAENPPSISAPANLAYVIYTSGSTGQPKGTLITHRNVFHLFAATRSLFRFDERDVWTLFHSYAFDFSVWELWGALLYGGRLVIVPYFVSRSPEEFYRLLIRERVTVLNQTPSAFRQLMPVDESTAPVRELELRLVIFGGEALELQSLRPWFARHGDEQPQLVNMYGITETTVHVTHHRMTLSELEHASGSVIGRAISSLQVYILDEHQQLVPIGVAGEICVGGEGLARGYLHRAELTAERFIPHPFSGEGGARLYRSGDRGRYRADGEVEYLGRIDQQVKIRGYRIELGEIEAVLNQHESVGEAIVMAREDVSGNKRLVSYVVARPAAALSVSELRECLQKRLPEHMIPSAFIFLDALPLTAHGKIDKKALPAPDASRPALEQNYVAPARPLELLLAQMWCEILGLERVGLHDNFFELGGNSIKGAIFINHLQERLGEIIHVVTIFTSPTVAQLAAYLNERYSEAVAGILGSETSEVSGSDTKHDRPRTLARVNVEMIERVRQLIHPLPPREKGLKSGRKNPPAIFVLSPPRSGSTLLRVMLAGHPALFAPPELELLSFNTLRERSETFTGAQAFWLEGALRAVMEARVCGADEAKALMREFEESGLTTQEFYRQLQAWLGKRRLVDKTPSYALDKSILRRAEEDFENALYIHLVRHPYGMIHSFEEAKMDQLFLGGGHPFSTRELAEIVWNISHRNILEFLQEVPQERQHRLGFEELVTRPEEVLESLCHFLSLELHTDMLQPYREKEKRMTDGLYKESRMLGDVKFHQHSSINAGVADRWAKKYTEDFLGDVSKELASQLGYTVAENTIEQEAFTSHSTEQARPVATGNELRTIPRRPPEMSSPIPLSFTQQGLFFLDQVLLHKSAYNIPLALRIHGPLDVEALLKSLHEIVRRHESLRTSFPVIDGVPAQQIAQQAFVPLLMMDLREFAKEEREDRLQQIATDDARLPFELKRGSLLRATLLRLDEDEHVLLVNMHHIVSDGWSMGIFWHELATLYDTFVTGQKSPLAELPVQYADFAIWQREWLSGANLEAQLGYWKQKLASASLLQLPTIRPRPPAQTFRGSDYVSSLSQELSQELQELSRREGVTLFMTLLAGFKLLLSRYAGQTDIVVGTPIAGRNRSEIEGLIGFFVNTLVLRTDLSGNPRFRELLKRVQEVALGAYAHQEVPFDKLVQELQVPRDQSRTPLFQVMFALANAPRPETKISTGLTLSAVGIHGGAAKFDLTVVARETGGGLSLSFEYNTDLFDAATIERMMRHLEILLAGIVADPDKRIDELAILTEEEQRQTRVAEHSQLIENAFPVACLQQLFEAQAGRTPDAVALVFEDERVSYRELNERANQLAHHLQSLGVGPDVLVAVCLERSVEMVSALLGILKAGGAYVPLDPAYPQERLAYMLNDCRAQVLITQEHLRDKLPHSTTEVLCLDSSWPTIALESRETPQVKVAHANLAYMIYTSGSTGQPKGAMNTHEAICNRLLWMQAAYGLDESDAVLQKTPFSFDVSVWEFFWPLLAGARLVIARPGGHQDASYLVQTIERERITTLHFVPSMLQVFLEERALERCRSLRRVICSGEALSFELQEKFFARVDAELHNLYGPTEAAVDVTSWRCERGSARTLVPIGRAIANTEVHVLDQSLTPLPVGVAGEIYIGGVALARGYLGRADLTAEKFIPHPFSLSAGARLYRTGDLGRRLAGGEIEFLGRFDHQVKLRGFRIELGEIEAVLSQQTGVAEAVVIAREDVPGDKRLVAYLVAKKGSDAGSEELRDFLKSKLPDYMIPSAYVKLDEMPLTPNGKVDRQALPAPGLLRTEDSPSSFIAPRSKLESQLVQIWEEVLNAKPIGVRDNFFDLGGHSLLAVKLFSRIEQATGSALSMTTLFDTATVEQQAELLSIPRPVACVTSLVPIQPQGHRPPLFCVHPWGGNVLCYSELAKHLGLDQPVYGLQARGIEQMRNPHTSIEAMAADYLAEIRGLQPEGPYHLCGWSSGGLIAFEMARQLEEQGRSVGLLALIDAYDLTELYTQTQIDESSAQERAARFISEAQIVTGAGETLFALVHYDEHLGLTYEAPNGFGLVQSRNVLDDYVNYYLYVERALKGYVPRPFNGRAVHFWTATRLSLSTPETKRIWGSLSTGGIQINEVPGEHFTMLRAPHVQTLAGHLKKYLASDL